MCVQVRPEGAETLPLHPLHPPSPPSPPSASLFIPHGLGFSLSFLIELIAHLVILIFAAQQFTSHPDDK